jgi:hypothetical protein
MSSAKKGSILFYEVAGAGSVHPFKPFFVASPKKEG